MAEGSTLAILFAVVLSTFRVSVPLVFASMGGILSERSGVVNIALEGLMLVGAFAAATVASLTHSPWLGLLAGMVGGMLLAAIYALFVIQARADQIVAGTAINLLAFGITPLVAKSLFDTAGTTPSLEMHDRFESAPLYLALVTVVLVALWFRRSRLGLWLGFAGEHPEALSTAGISVRAVRWFGVVAAGALAGIGGASLSIFLSSSFSRGMTAGRGFMALAALIFGKWRPIPTLFACLFFGLTDAIQIRLQGVPVFGNNPIPVQFIQILPYLFTILVLAGFMGKSRPPRALGAPWVGMLPWIVLPAFFFTQGCEFSAVKEKVLAKLGTVVPHTPPSSAPSNPAERASRANAELVAEAIRVTMNREPRNAELFGSYVESMNQGASFEGVLNGWIHSADFRNTETHSPPASPAAREFFVSELLKLQNELGMKAIRVTAETGKPLERFGIPTGVPPSGEAKSQVLAVSAADYEKIFARSTLPTLKRVIFDAILARVDEGMRDPKADPLGKWYAETAVRLGGYGVDFGLPQRNQVDLAFHQAWFKTQMSDSMKSSRGRDLVLWESTNRYFRILNRLQTVLGKKNK